MNGGTMPTLLLIDDEPVIQHAFRKAFHPPEYETLAARTVAEALKLLVERHPEVPRYQLELARIASSVAAGSTRRSGRPRGGS